MGRNEDLQRSLRYDFKKPELLDEALTHRTFTEENAGIPHNGRLAFLGDAVLQLVITKLLVRNAAPGDFKHLRQGALTKKRQKLVKNERFSRMSEFFGIAPEAGIGEKKLTGKAQIKRQASAFEAVIGAIYEDNGSQLEPTSEIIRELYEREEPTGSLWN